MKCQLCFKETAISEARGILAGLIVVLACLQAACQTVSRPDHLVERDQRSHGRIAVVAARFEPEYEFSPLATGKGEAAWRGALDASGPCFQLWIFAVICAPIAATAGAISSASDAATSEQVAAAKAGAQRAINALKLQEVAHQAVLGYAETAGLRLGRIEGRGPVNQKDLPSYVEAKDTADTIIEVSVLNVRAVTAGHLDFRAGLVVQARVRVLSTRDGKEIDTFTVRGGVGEYKSLDAWLAADGAPIRAGLERSTASVAEQAIDEILLIYHPRRLPQQEAGGTTERVPAYALRAVEPPLRIKFPFPWEPMTYGWLERFALTTLRPEFRWEAWPRGFDVARGSGPGQAREIRYDLRILGYEGVVYERRGLDQPAHRLEQPLKPCSTYRWTVRARFVLNDAPRATEWMGAFNTIGGEVAPWSIRRGGAGAPPLEMISGNAAPFYPIVETPGAEGEACPGR